LLSNNSQVQRVIFVGDDQRMRAIDHSVFRKSSTIFNSSTGNYETCEAEKENVVVYLGALVERKGFHILAKAWGNVRKQIPDAQLYVLGSGALYDRQQKLGPLALAEESYEEKVVRLLGGKEALHSNGVHFLGNLGSEKNQVMIKSKVGVVNPSGLTENCPMSVVEFYQIGIPVVSSKKYGLRDMVIHGKTGFLGQSDKDLSRSIVKFLDGSANPNVFGKNGLEFAKSKFSPMVIAEEWNSIFNGNFNNNCAIHGYWVHKLFSRIKHWHLLPESFPMVEDQKIYLANLRHKLWASLR
jgi:glycosyltransferase involved in cell wall biosynthesis